MTFSLPPPAARALRLLAAAAIVLSALGVALPARAASATVVISQIYGGGGNSTAVYANDFIELYNRGSSAVSLAGWSLQYTSATGTGNFGANSGQLTELSGTIAPGQYLLVQEASGGAVGAALPAADITDATPINMSASAGKVALVATTASLGCNGGSSPCPAAALAQIVDLVGYGAANFYEGSGPAPAPSNSTAILRAGNGAVDTDNNAADFATGAPTPRNSSTGGATSLSATGAASPQSVIVGASTLLTVAVTPATNPASSGLTVTADLTAIGGSATQTLYDDGTNGDATAGDTVFSYQATVAAATAPGALSLNAAISDAEGRSAGATIAVTVLAANACAAPYTPIYAVQGDGAASPLVGQTVTISGVVSADFSGSSRQNGFYIQDPTGDGNPLTSDGVFVFLPAANPLSATPIAVGDRLLLRATVKEFNTLTELDSVSAITACGSGAVSPTAVALPEQTNGDLERYEGMLISIPQMLTVDQNYFQGRYGEVTLSSGGRLYQPTNSLIPGSPEALAQADENARRLIVLDDGSTQQNPNPIPYIGADGTLRAGDTVSGLTGVLDYGPISSDSSVRDYRVQPTQPVSFTRVNERSAAPEPVGGNFKVASFNVLNFFNGNGTGQDGAAGGFPTERGADTLAEFQRQRAKIVAAITAIDPDVIGLIEVENDGTDSLSAIQNLVNALNDATAPGRYDFIREPAPGGDAIKVSLVYQPARVTPVGPAISDDNPLNNRNPLAQTFRHNATGDSVTVVINHFKSKGSCPADATDPNADQGDGQGCWNAVRVQQAQELLAFIATLKARSSDSDVLVIGDLNSYGKEDPIRELTANGLVDQLAKNIAGPYSYVFDGLSGYLDHALTSASLDAKVSGVTEWHINADEPSVIDYNTEFKPQDLYAPTPYRASDHDPVVIGFTLVNQPPVAQAQALTTAEDTPLALTLAATDAEGDALTYRVTSGPAHGTLSGDAPNLTYTPAANYNGPDSFTFVASDGRADSAPATVTIAVTPVNDAPTARGDTATTDRKTPIDINVLANDSDVDGDALTVTYVRQPASGTVTINPDGTLHYVPQPGFTGIVWFYYVVSDGHGGSDRAIVALLVTK